MFRSSQVRRKTPSVALTWLIVSHELMELSSYGFTVKTQKIFLLLHAAGHLHDGDGKTVRRGCKHSRGQRNVVLVQEFCSGKS